MFNKPSHFKLPSDTLTGALSSLPVPIYSFHTESRFGYQKVWITAAQSYGVAWPKAAGYNEMPYRIIMQNHWCIRKSKVPGEASMHFRFIYISDI